MMEASINGFVHTENEIRLKDNYFVKSDINIWSFQKKVVTLQRILIPITLYV